jgi:hypothetical protein
MSSTVIYALGYAALVALVAFIMVAAFAPPCPKCAAQDTTLLVAQCEAAQRRLMDCQDERGRLQRRVEEIMANCPGYPADEEQP